MANRYWVGGTASWDGTVGTKWSATSGGSGGASVPTSADNVFFDQASTYTVTVATGGGAFADITVSAGTVTFTGTVGTVCAGNISFSTGTVWNVTGTLSLQDNASVKTITTNGTVMNCNITMGSSTGASYQLLDALTLGSTRTFTINRGTLDLNAKSLTTGKFIATGSVRTIAFGSGGSITCTFAGGTVYDTGSISPANLTITGTPLVNISYSGATATTVVTSTITSAQAVSFNITAGTYTLTFTGGFKDINFTGFSGVWGTGTANFPFYGNVTLSSTMTTSGTGTLNPVSSSGTQTITTNGTTFSGSISQDNTGTFQLNDATRVGQAYFLNFGTLDLNGKNLTALVFSTSNSNVRTFAANGGTLTCTGTTGNVFALDVYANITVTGSPVVNITNSTATGISVFTGRLSESNTFSFNFTAGTYTLNFLGLAGYTAKNVNFTGFSGTLQTITGSPTIYGSLTISSTMTLAAANFALVFGATSGTQVITTNGKTVNYPVTVNGIGGTVQLADALTINASYPLTLTNGTFDGNSKTIAGASSFSMVTGSVTAKNISTALAFTHTSGTLTQGANNATGAYTLNAGTLDLGGFTLTTPTFITATGTKNLTFNAGTLAVTNATTTAFNNAVPTGFTTTAGTGSGKISMTAATAKTFVGGGSIYNGTISNDGAGALTISGNNTIDTVTTTSGSVAITGNNTITTISNTVRPVTFTFTAGTTQTFTDWLISGSVGNLVTIQSATAASHTLSKASGNVSSNYLSISRSTATGGATWYAGANSTDGGNNTGWSFTNAPVPNVYAAFEGWDRASGWGIGPWGTGSVTVGLATGYVGSVVVSYSISVPVTGVQATGFVGTPLIALSPNVSVTGVSATGLVGSVSAAVTSFAYPTGVSATGLVGNVSTDLQSFAYPTGVSSLGRVGNATLIVDSTVSPTGVNATGQVSGVSIQTYTNVFVVGQYASGYVGQTTVSINMTVDLAGVYATGYVGQAFVWGQILPDQNPGWTGISPSQSPLWVEIGASQTPGWVQILP